MQNNADHKPKNRVKKIFITVIVLFALAVPTLAVTHNVKKDITQSDISFIKKILTQSRKDLGLLKSNAHKSFAHEINTIRAIQDSAFVTAPKVSLIPINSPREPKDLYATKAAYCGDRARYIDKALRHIGFTTRYASLYHNADDLNFISTLLTKSSQSKADSHALVEVLTSKGWLIVDTRKHWLSITSAKQPISLETLKDKKLSHFQWDKSNKEEAWPLLDRNYYIIYELYSRHGQFYAPYTKYIPDIHWQGFFKHNIKRMLPI